MAALSKWRSCVARRLWWGYGAWDCAGGGAELAARRRAARGRWGEGKRRLPQRDRLCGADHRLWKGVSGPGGGRGGVLWARPGFVRERGRLGCASVGPRGRGMQAARIQPVVSRGKRRGRAPYCFVGQGIPENRWCRCKKRRLFLVAVVRKETAAFRCPCKPQKLLYEWWSAWLVSTDAPRW